MTATGFVAVAATAGCLVLGAAYLHTRRLNERYKDALMDAARTLHAAHTAIAVLDAHRRARSSSTQSSTN